MGVVILTGEGPLAFCSGGDQRVRGSKGGYVTGADPDQAGHHEVVGRFHVTDCTCRSGGCRTGGRDGGGLRVGGGHVLHVICDLTIAADNARFGQTGPRSARSTAVLARVFSHDWWVPRKPKRSGSFAVSTTRRRRCRWAW